MLSDSWDSFIQQVFKEFSSAQGSGPDPGVRGRDSGQDWWNPCLRGVFILVARQTVCDSRECQSYKETSQVKGLECGGGPKWCFFQRLGPSWGENLRSQGRKGWASPPPVCTGAGANNSLEARGLCSWGRAGGPQVDGAGCRIWGEVWVGTGSCGGHRLMWGLQAMVQTVMGGLWTGSEQGSGLVFSTYPFGLERSGNSWGARMEVQRLQRGRLLWFPRD